MPVCCLLSVHDSRKTVYRSPHETQHEEHRCDRSARPPLPPHVTQVFSIASNSHALHSPSLSSPRPKQQRPRPNRGPHAALRLNCAVGVVLKLLTGDFRLQGDSCIRDDGWLHGEAYIIQQIVLFEPRLDLQRSGQQMRGMVALLHGRCFIQRGALFCSRADACRFDATAKACTTISTCHRLGFSSFGAWRMDHHHYIALSALTKVSSTSFVASTTSLSPRSTAPRAQHQLTVTWQKRLARYRCTFTASICL